MPLINVMRIHAPTTTVYTATDKLHAAVGMLGMVKTAKQGLTLMLHIGIVLQHCADSHRQASCSCWHVGYGQNSKTRSHINATHRHCATTLCRQPQTSCMESSRPQNILNVLSTTLQLGMYTTTYANIWTNSPTG